MLLKDYPHTCTNEVISHIIMIWLGNYYMDVHQTDEGFITTAEQYETCDTDDSILCLNVDGILPYIIDKDHKNVSWIFTDKMKLVYLSTTSDLPKTVICIKLDCNRLCLVSTDADWNKKR
jgi:hypothetical protein